MKNKIKLFVGASFALLTLAACGQNASAPSFTPLEEKDAAPIIEKMKIATDFDDGRIYGNIYLPEKIDDYKVTWVSSNKKVVSDKDKNGFKAGVVTRQNKATVVTMTGYAVNDEGKGVKYEQELKIAEKAPELDDEDYEAYLFGHFVGEGSGVNKNNVKYATGEQMFFALADVGQGLKFRDLKGPDPESPLDSLRPVLTSSVGERGVRDPYICRSAEGDKFYLIATDLSVYTRGGWGNNAGQATKTGSHSVVFWESHDLVNWSKERLIEVAAPNAGMAWAPEMIYCEETGEYLIFFSSTILDDYAQGTNAKILKRDSVYYTATRDFIHFSETKQFIDNQPYPEGYNNTQETDQYATNNDERKIIDGSVMKIGDWYYSAAKDGGNNENHGGILLQKTQDLYDSESWEKVAELADFIPSVDINNSIKNVTPTNKVFEGPEWFVLNQADREDPNEVEIGLMADYYANTSVGYVPFATTDVEDKDAWRTLVSGKTEDADYDFSGATKRHGTILRITADEAEALKEAFPFAK